MTYQSLDSGSLTAVMPAVSILGLAGQSDVYLIEPDTLGVPNEAEWNGGINDARKMTETGDFYDLSSGGYSPSTTTYGSPATYGFWHDWSVKGANATIDILGTGVDDDKATLFL